MRYASVCSGVEAASLAWMPLGWEPVWFSEIEPFPCEVLKQRFPGVQNLGDMTKIDGEKYAGTVDLLVGGTPCQGFSVAGKQGGLGDPRSALCLAYCRLLGTMRPRWFVWENVPGVFSTNGGEDFKAFLCAIDEIGYSVAWRVLDAQYVRVDGYPRAVPQRRRRVFVVGYLGEWQYPAEVLFEPGCLHRDTPPRREAGTGIARSVTASTGGASGKEQQHTFVGAGGKPLNAICMAHGQSNAEISEAVSPALTCDHEAPIAFDWAASPAQGLSVGIDYCHTLMANRNGEPAVCYENHAQDSRIKEIDCSPVLSAKAGTGGGNTPLVRECFPINSMIIGKEVKEGDRQTTGIGNAGDPYPTIGTLHHHAVAIAENVIGRQVENGGNGIGAQEELAYTLNASGVMGVANNYAVRRLTPRECERLMGFPDDWTRIPWRGKPAEECPDSPRYKACGNSMCVNVMRWIGMRIENVERKMR